MYAKRMNAELLTSEPRKLRRQTVEMYASAAEVHLVSLCP